MDSLDCYNKFKMVFGFSPYVSAVMLSRVRAICADTLVLDIGNMKAGGVREQYDMRYIFRKGNDPDSMMADTVTRVEHILTNLP